MTDITIIVPIHTYNENVKTLLTKAIESVNKNKETYDGGTLLPLIVGPNNVIQSINVDFGNEKMEYCVNDTEHTDFCSQINKAVEKVTTDYFSILEFDDTYTDNWFKLANEYFYTNENVSLFLPINTLSFEGKPALTQFVNEIAWTSSFSNEIGYLDFDCLNDYSGFNLTGGIFNTKDFIQVGGFKPSIKVAFNYELLLRLAKKELKIFVVPKEGYNHNIGRTDSLTDIYNKSLSADDINKWFVLAKTECAFTKDRGTTLDNVKEEVVK